MSDKEDRKVKQRTEKYGKTIKTLKMNCVTFIINFIEKSLFLQADIKMHVLNLYPLKVYMVCSMQYTRHVCIFMGLVVGRGGWGHQKHFHGVGRGKGRVGSSKAFSWGWSWEGEGGVIKSIFMGLVVGRGGWGHQKHFHGVGRGKGRVGSSKAFS